jgi:hypothetical protein
MMFIKLLGIDSNFVQAFRSTRRYRVNEEPRDQLERLVSNHRKVAKDSKPDQLKYLVLAGDDDLPPKVYGRVTGLEPYEEGYIAYIKTSKTAWSKPHVIIRELAGDANRRNMFVYARGFSTDGAFRWAIPSSKVEIDPDKAFERSERLFDFVFNIQILREGKEDTAWGKATAIMPTVTSRTRMAEVEHPNLVERPSYDENMVGR